MTPVLSVRGLEKRFGAVVAADALSFDIPANQKISLIGANGAGKTTFVNMVTGYLKPDRGSIVLDGIDIGRRSPRSVARLGISRSFQIPQLFVELTAAENLAVALSGVSTRMSLRAQAKAQGRHEHAVELLERFGLADSEVGGVEMGGDGEDQGGRYDQGPVRDVAHQIVPRSVDN